MITFRSSIASLALIGALTVAGAAAQTASEQPSTKVTVTDKGFEPAKLTVKAGTPARITFVRTAEKTCATEIVIKDHNIRQALPLNKPVTVEFTPAKTGELTFTCGQDMFKGTIVVG
jgi:plastocyanin domain-containing protein